MRRLRSFSLAVALGALTLAASAAGCHRDGCVGGDDGQCVPPAACPALVYAACTAPKLRVEQIGPNDPERVAGPKALAAEGDYLLENDLVRVVLDAPDHPHFIGPSGGAILDLAPLGKSTLGKSTGDQTNAIYHAAGVLPRDAVHYESAAILDPGVDPSGPGAYAAVIALAAVMDRKPALPDRWAMTDRKSEPVTHCARSMSWISVIRTGSVSG